MSIWDFISDTLFQDSDLTISDSDIPSGSGGINREGYTYGQLRRRTIIPEVMRGISNPVVQRWAEECNARNRNGFVMRKMSVSQAASAIGNMLDCVPHEDISGYVYMVPNWAHKWFRHRGYVSAILGNE